MATQDTSQIKEKILRILRIRGPSLPVHVAKELGISMLFSSAFLSELLSEKQIKISYLRVGSSPVYFLPGQESGLERYSQHLKSKEKEAFLLLKEKKFLKDDQQPPAIRVAIRSINDFAIPFKRGEEIFWRYFTVSENDFKTSSSTAKTPSLLIKPSQNILIKSETNKQSEPIQNEVGNRKEISKELNIFNEKKEKKPKKTLKKKTIRKKQENKFFIKVKEFLTKRGIEISDIEGFSKNDLFLRVNIKGEEKLLVAYNKKRVNETEIIKAHKKASELNLSYIILSLGGPLKKLSNLIEAARNLERIEKIE